MQLSAHLPALIVLVPLLVAPLCSLFNSSRIAWWLSVLASAFCFISAIALLQVLESVDSFAYDMGGWAAPLGVELRVDYMSALLLLVLGGIALLVVVFALHSVESEIAAPRLP